MIKKRKTSKMRRNTHTQKFSSNLFHHFSIYTERQLKLKINSSKISGNRVPLLIEYSRSLENKIHCKANN